MTSARLHLLAEEFINAQFVVKSGSARLAETGNVPTRLSQIKAECTYSFIFTTQNCFFFLTKSASILSAPDHCEILQL